MVDQQRFTKIGAEGIALSNDAATWEAVLDNTTGLMWSVKTKKAEDWKSAQKLPAKVKAAGFKDWRMPTVEELFLLADRSRISPAIDTDFFPDTPSDWFWSSTTYKGSASVYAWCVGFDNGGSFWYGQNGGGFVRAVRVGQ